MEETSMLGSKAKDTITGFEGTVTATCEYLHDKPSARLETLKDGKVVAEWFQISRLVTVVEPA